MTAPQPPLEIVRAAAARAVGASQTVRAIEHGRAALVLVARDADRKIVEPVLRAAERRGIPLVEVESKRELGRACGIAVEAAAAAVLVPPDAAGS